ncbi:uncharacterized protein K460DRAFT_402291 [Cucurbitaria berberidis CBS 394.84]|uniref:Uncharacterized protein n=1 Tax=Cucurbitaria berberidis CBS 394.84 TaxID=1168544 RepID=A0A9P4GKV2_9PLEO|nr:uncharacterized protein K460DRAFT_402291 [Cucurbitaria berberidis CBS 394.84]KAF1846925.1 hypothetical protein K460DRAFT_402291 [Cucurbitaria berberidis CBS 394.84]
MVNKWCSQKGWVEWQGRQYQEEMRKAASVAAEQAEYQRFCDFAGNNCPAGQYRNLSGSHFEVTYNANSEVKFACLTRSEARSPGWEWLPMFPVGNDGDFYAWQGRPEEEADYVLVVKVDVGYDEVRYVHSASLGQWMWTVQNRPAWLVKINNTVMYGAPIPGPCWYDRSRATFVHRNGAWEHVTLKLVEELGLDYRPSFAPGQPPVVAPQPLALDLGVQAPAQNEDIAPPPSLPSSVNQDGEFLQDRPPAVGDEQQLFGDFWPGSSTAQEPTEWLPEFVPESPSMFPAETAGPPPQANAELQLQPSEYMQLNAQEQWFGGPEAPTTGDPDIGSEEWIDEIFRQMEIDNQDPNERSADVSGSL